MLTLGEARKRAVCVSVGSISERQGVRNPSNAPAEKTTHDTPSSFQRHQMEPWLNEAAHEGGRPLVSRAHDVQRQRVRAGKNDFKSDPRLAGVAATTTVSRRVQGSLRGGEEPTRVLL